MTESTLSRTDAAIDHAREELSKADPVIEQIRDEYLAISVSGPGDEAGFQTATTALGRVKRLRIDVEKTRKALKADALRYGKVVDGEAKRIKAQIEPIEKHLNEQADIVRLETARLKAEEERQREAQIQEWVKKLSDVGAPIDLDAIRSMSATEFHFHYLSAKKRWDEAEADRQAEHEQLQRERQELEAEKAELEELRAEKRQREQAAEQKRKEARDAELKPVRRQLQALAAEVKSFEIPGPLTAYAEPLAEILADAAAQIESLVD